MNLKKIRDLIKARVLTDHIVEEEITGFTGDTRITTKGNLFFAFSPEDYSRHSFAGSSFPDTHRFILEAFQRGAIAAVAHEEQVRADESLRPFYNRLLLVDDSIGAMQAIAANVLEEWNGPVVGITGSAGKTTTKDLTAHVLGKSGRRVLKSQKNFNNELGVPLSILQMVSAGRKSEDYDIAVLEMGMSTSGEIARLCKVASPDVGAELLVAPVHLEYLGTIEKIAAAKAELVESLGAEGTAILNTDDSLVSAMRTKHEGRILTFGINNKADVMARDIDVQGLGLRRFRLSTPLGEADVKLHMIGRYNMMNALAAAAVTTYFGIGPEDIASALNSASPSEMRGEIIRFAGGITLVDDSYNSNPVALLSVVRALKEELEASRRVAKDELQVSRRMVVAGEMLELGPESAQMHRTVGGEIAHLDIDLLWGVRGMARELVEGARDEGIPHERTRFFATSEEAAAALLDVVSPGDVILVKGSRGVQTDKIVKMLRESLSVLEK